MLLQNAISISLSSTVRACGRPPLKRSWDSHVARPHGGLVLRGEPSWCLDNITAIVVQVLLCTAAVHYG